MTDLAPSVAALAWNALGGASATLAALDFAGEGNLPSAYEVTAVASATVAAAALSVAELVGCRTGKLPPVIVDRRLASLWYGWSIQPVGWKLPPSSDPIIGDYPTADGWIRLHTNAPHHHAAAVHVLGCGGSREAVARAVAERRAEELEAAVVASGGCAAEMRTEAAWSAHPQGKAVAAEPLVHMAGMADVGRAEWEIAPAQPLAGIRVLDLTRVLAGPTASRFLAGFGAEVLRIDPPGWDEPGLVPEVTLGKRCARLDLRSPDGRARFERLLSQAHVFLNGYRPGALDGLGYGAAARRALSPGLVDVCLSAYGWTGPWAGRRGFDSLLQMSAGIADTGMRWQKTDRPFPLPVQALDHATGYLMAAAAVRGLTRRLAGGQGTEARLSLARTARLLVDQGRAERLSAFAAETPDDLSPEVEATQWGPARRLRPPVSIAGSPMRWSRPASALGTARAAW